MPDYDNDIGLQKYDGSFDCHKFITFGTLIKSHFVENVMFPQGNWVSYSLFDIS